MWIRLINRQSLRHILIKQNVNFTSFEEGKKDFYEPKPRDNDVIFMAFVKEMKCQNEKKTLEAVNNQILSWQNPGFISSFTFQFVEFFRQVSILRKKNTSILSRNHTSGFESTKTELVLLPDILNVLPWCASLNPRCPSGEFHKLRTQPTPEKVSGNQIRRAADPLVKNFSTNDEST